VRKKLGVIKYIAECKTLQKISKHQLSSIAIKTNAAMFIQVSFAVYDIGFTVIYCMQHTAESPTCFSVRKTNYLREVKRWRWRQFEHLIGLAVQCSWQGVCH